MSFTAETGSGHLAAMGGAPDGGGAKPRAATDGNGAGGHRRLRRL